MKGRKFVVLSDNLFDENGYQQSPGGRNCKVLRSGNDYFVKSITYHEGCNDVIYPVTRGEDYYLYNLQKNRQHLPFDYKQN